MIQPNHLIEEKDFDEVISAIEYNVPIAYLDLLIEKKNYPLNKFIIFKNGEIKSPLYSAIANNHFKIADFIISKGGDINFTQHNINIVKLLIEKNLLTTKVLSYLLNKNWNIMEIKDYIYDYSFNFNLASKYIKYKCDKNFVIKLLKIYQSKKSISKDQFDKIIINERNFDVPYQWYYRCIYCSSFDQLKFFSCYDIPSSIREKIEFIMDNNNDIIYPGFSLKLYEFIINYKYKNIFLNNILDINHLNRYLNKILIKKRMELSQFIKNGNMERIFYFYQENEILISDINSSDYDVLTNCITSGFSIDSLKKIISLFSYTNFNYEIPNSLINESVPLVIYTLLINRRDVCTFLISKGADINYRFLDKDNSFNNVIQFLIHQKNFSYENFDYIIEILKNKFKKIEKLNIPQYILKLLIKEKKNKTFLLLVKEFLHYNDFQDEWYTFALKNDNYKIIENLFVIDKRSSEQKVKYILKELKKAGGDDKILTYYLQQ
ncbi:hypothetical protein BCR36DRAFT_305058 [Piromyces finnis]|uniref:Uncharacterized protein n=1 Tax=Piromyces finnis TaxID=1754191 RepID=A0A1Y1UZR1_9FUNG|nr:hypothetical protein BCR36DRAFT_305058 [Piromyces finnis]|eukprot:ORX42944.1 hypothetical protein BCR36DRAFT_305058 [Piromyces finnis]